MKQKITVSEGGGGGFGATGASWASGRSKRQWKGPIAARPINFAENTPMKERQLTKAKERVDYVILEELTDVVKYEAMSMVDLLLGVDTEPKKALREKVKKHKHVVFDETPTIIEYKTSKQKKDSNFDEEEKVSDDQPSNASASGRVTLIERLTEEVIITNTKEQEIPRQRKAKGQRLAARPVTIVEEVTEVKEEIKAEDQEVVKKQVEESSSSEEVEYYKESIEGICDFNFCQEKTFMRCDYDMNDIIDPRSSKCQLVLTCRWKGIRGCERQFCHLHAGKLIYWPSSCCGSKRSIALLPCDDCYYWVKYVKCKFYGTICLVILWMALVTLIVYFSMQGVKGTYDYEYKMNQF